MLKQQCSQHYKIAAIHLNKQGTTDVLQDLPWHPLQSHGASHQLQQGTANTTQQGC